MTLSLIPSTKALLVAVATPLDRDLRPDAERLAAHCRWLISHGCDGVAVFGTTGEGAEMAIADRMEALDRLLAAGIEPGRVVVSIGAASIADNVALARHALERDVAGLLLMPPTIFRNSITEEGTFRFFSEVIDRTRETDMRLLLYHFPDISGVPLTPRVVRRLDQRFAGAIAGIKDSGGDVEFTEDLIRRFSHLSIYTGSETHLPQLIASGARGTICGLANVMPRLLRAMVDAPTAFDGRRFLPDLVSGDAILSRQPFVVSLKAALATVTDAAWRRVLPPLAELPLQEERLLAADFRRWEESLAPDLRSLFPDTEASDGGNVVALRRSA